MRIGCVMHDPAGVEVEPGKAAGADAAQRAFLAALFNRYREALLRHVGRMVRSREDAADLVQDTYVRVMDRISVARFDAAARAYLFQTATNLARDYYRRQRFRAHAPLDDVPDEGPASHDPAPEDLVAADQLTATLRVAIAQMPEDARNVFLLARSRQMAYGEIARHLGLGQRTVERRMAEAMAYLSRRLEDAP
jgi:RNA polymerase sigma factor (sigma-70 family)